ncbi:MAG TPA: tetratricopeptide repeat protein [Planctomycetota bacterium]|nr:tetratricopeptide repeat protein [Planctomycetota bacterium]
MSLESRKNTLDDPGAELLDRASGLWERYGRIVLGVVVGLAVVGVSAYYVMAGSARKENAASERLAEASDLFWRADYDRSRTIAQEIVKQYGDTPSGIDALRIAGDDAYWRGNWKDAAADYEAYLKKRSSGLLANGVRRSLGYAQESLGQYAAAAANFDQLVGQIDRETSGEMLFAAGRCLVADKKPEEAKKRYQRIIDEFPDSSFQAQARIELGKLAPVFAN